MHARSKKESGVWSAITDVNIRADHPKLLPRLKSASRALRCQSDDLGTVSKPMNGPQSYHEFPSPFPSPTEGRGDFHEAPDGSLSLLGEGRGEGEKGYATLIRSTILRLSRILRQSVYRLAGP